MNSAEFRERFLNYIRFASAATVAFWGGAMLLASLGVPAGGLSVDGASLQYVSVAIIGGLLFTAALGVLQARSYGLVCLAIAWVAIAVYQLDGPSNLLGTSLARGAIPSFLSTLPRFKALLVPTL